MSSFIYPNSATRKLYGEAGRALKRQQERFSDILIKEGMKANKNLSALESEMLSKIEAHQIRYKKLKRAFVVTVTILLIVILTLVL